MPGRPLLPSEAASVGSWFQAIWPGRLVRQQIEARVKTTAGIYKIAQPQLASVTVPFPLLAEQHRIVAEVDRRLSLVREVKAEVACRPSCKGQSSESPIALR